MRLRNQLSITGKSISAEKLSVLWEKSILTNDTWSLSGLSENYLRVESQSQQSLYNCISQVEIEDLNGMTLLAKEIL